MAGTATVTAGMSDDEIRRATQAADEVVVEGDAAFRRRVGALFGVPEDDLGLEPLDIPTFLRRPDNGIVQQAPSAPSKPGETPSPQRRQEVQYDTQPRPTFEDPRAPAGAAPIEPSPVSPRPSRADLPPELMFRPPAAAIAPEPGPDVPWGGAAPDGGRDYVGHFGMKGVLGDGEVYSSPRSGGGGGPWIVVGVLIAVLIAVTYWLVAPLGVKAVINHLPPPPPPLAPPTTQPSTPPPSPAELVDIIKALSWPVVVLFVVSVVGFLAWRAMNTGHSVEVKWKVAKVGEGSMVLKKTITRMPKSPKKAAA